jgi:NMD protein affecting ribosome stability and mRNA decay
MKKGFSHDQPKRFDRQLEEEHKDPYRPKTKLPEPTVCPQCGLVFHDGHWQQTARPNQAHESLCPACHRTNDHFPAGYVTLESDFVQQHRDELLTLARTTEEREKSQHPLQRIMEIIEEGNKITITTTDIHVARRIGEAIHSAYKGNLDVNYGPEDYIIRLTWSR